MRRPFPPTKILHCPQRIKAKINSSLKGRSYLKHLLLFFFEISFTPTNVSSQKKKKTKNKKQKKKKQKQKQNAKRKKKKEKQKEKKIKTNMVQLHKTLSEFM